MAPRLIAPSHGPVWYDPNLILHSYERWTGDGVKRLVSIPYVSMHNSTRVMVERLAVRLSEQGLSVICRDLGSELDSLTVETSYFITDLVYSAAVVMATPTVLGGPHPNIAYAALVANALRPKMRFLGVMGSYGWGTRMVETIDSLTANLKMERLKPLLIKGLPTDEDLARVDQMALRSEKIRNIPDLIR